MNRLTTRIEETVYYSKGKYAPNTLSAEMEIWEVRECMKKLAAYEDTGLEPEDVLTSDEMREINIKLGELIDYINLEEQGRLIKLPCKVGDTVYVNAKTFGTHDDIEYAEAEVVSIRITKKQTFLKLRIFALGFDGMPYGCKNYSISSIGKTVFLTKVEAEKALKESEEKECN